MDSKNRRTKGQLQAMEPIIIVVMLGLIIGLVLLFYVRLSGTQAQTTQKITSSEEDVVMLTKVSRMPELLCPSTIASDTNCIDLGKASSFSAITTTAQGKMYYNSLFGNSNIILHWINFSSGNADAVINDMTLYSALDQRSLGKNSSGVSTSTTYFFVYDPITKSNDLAWLDVVRPR